MRATTGRVAAETATTFVAGPTHATGEASDWPKRRQERRCAQSALCS